MAKPGSEIIPSPEPAIAFGDGQGGQAAKVKYGGYPYELDYSLSLIDPSRVSISFISEDGTYDEEQLKKDIVDEGTKASPTAIIYCGGAQTFYGYPLKYAISRAPRGNILTVEYYDSSIGQLDNRIVVLSGKDIPLVKAPDQAGDPLITYNYIDSNPCSDHIINLGKQYVRNSTGIPQSYSTSCTSPDDVVQVLYTNKELKEALDAARIPYDSDTIEVLWNASTNELFYENFHGTLRDVLRQWGERMGFTFFWETPQGGVDPAVDSAGGRLVFISLKDGLLYKDLEEVTDKMMGACNLLSATKSLSMEQTFNKAISANYTNQGIGQGQQSDQFMLLDLLTLPIRGCTTDEGKDWNEKKGAPLLTGPPWEYNGGWLASAEGDVGNDPRYLRREKFRDWYKEWDNPNYIPDDDEDAQKRVWLQYTPYRPTMQGFLGADNGTEAFWDTYDEFEDYIRLVKAAALGQDFFKAYVFFKAMKRSGTLGTDMNPDDIGERPVAPNGVPLTTIEDYMTFAASGQDANGEVAAMNADQAITKLARAGYNVIAHSELNELTAGSGTPAADLSPDQKVMIRQVPGQWYIINMVPTDSAGGFLTRRQNPITGNYDTLIPDLTENKALSKILSTDPGASSAPVPAVRAANMKICRGTVLGRDCLTVKPLDPHYKAVQNLYTEVNSRLPGKCGNKNTQLAIESVDEESAVYRTYFAGDTREDDVSPIDTKNGSPYFFSYVYQHGNSVVLDSAQHDAIYRQLKYIAENAGRFWVSPELLTAREFNQRTYDEEGVKFTDKFLDVNDSVLRSLFMEFDPIAAAAQAPWESSEYTEFMGETFTKSAESSQKQLNGFKGEIKPAQTPPRPCDYDNGEKFAGDTSETEENTMAPNIEQMILKVIEKTMPNVFDSCSDTTANTEAKGFKITEVETVVVKDDAGVDKHQLKDAYVLNTDYTDGGYGYSLAMNGGSGPLITISKDGEAISGYSVKLIIEQQIITQILIENASSTTWDDGNGLEIEIQPPLEDEQINFFKEPVADTSLSYMDSITRTNLNLRNAQKKIACCCTDLDEGVVVMDKGSQLRTPIGETVKKSIKRLSEATNLALSGMRQANLVQDYNRDGKVITFSTNLIPISALDTSATPDAKDELDWIVDQIKIGKDGLDPTYQERFYIMPEPQENTSGSQCMMATEDVSFLVKGDKFEMMCLGVGKEGDGDPKPLVKQTLPPSPNDGGIDGCYGFTGHADGINAKEMQIDFLQPSDEDLKVSFACGKSWVELSETEKQEKLTEIREKLIEFVKKRMYKQTEPSHEANVTIADNVLQDSNGDPVSFADLMGDSTEGIPSVRQGLESLSIKVGGDGNTITFTVGTRKKLQSLKKNFNLWREFHPRSFNVLQQNPGQQ